ncbi:hypothetical protein PIROE2DRAFT_1421 [Piromyces sp. E2]|nr:hypothetical protein PIROE2DRAFT_1421 [Piromyces sp. E2]|eukprot:OUM70536.1 hypothetical protein PIROE2DRAFT_1421 [Piromyces sp. E2]
MEKPLTFINLCNTTENNNDNNDNDFIKIGYDVGDSSKWIYIEKLKVSLIPDDDINNEIIEENYVEWEINELSIKKEKLYSPEFTIGGCKCNKNVSVLLVKSLSKNEKCDVCASLILSIGRKDYYETFHSLRFKHCIKRNPVNSLIFDDSKIIVSVFIRIYKDELGTLFENLKFWDSRSKTGYIGLKKRFNYDGVNSLLQSLYFNNSFKRVN